MHAPGIAAAPETLRLASPAFPDQTPMPERFGGPGFGADVSPPLTWAYLPAGTAELVLVMQEPHAPLPRPVVHLIARGLAPTAGACRRAR